MNDLAVAKKEQPLSTRFVNKVTAEFSGSVGEVALTKFQKRLAQNYFIALDGGLAKAEAKRLAKGKNQDPIPVTWANVNMDKLAQDVVACARIGLDPAQRNHVAMMPFKNNTTNKYDIVFIEGYRGIGLKAFKYGMDIPDAVIVELVYSKDQFRSIKKDKDNDVEAYAFKIENDFDRGDIVGGFFYHMYAERPQKNKLVVMTLKDILKRKPRYASPEFWGGDKPTYDQAGKRNGVEHTDGWFEKMCYKTVYRAAYGDITIDSQKIDDDFLRLQAMEDRMVEQEIEENANKGDVIDVDAHDEPAVKESPPDPPPKQGPSEDKGPPGPIPPPIGPATQAAMQPAPDF